MFPPETKSNNFVNVEDDVGSAFVKDSETKEMKKAEAMGMSMTTVFANCSDMTSEDMCFHVSIASKKSVKWEG